MSCVYEIWIGDYFYQGSTKDFERRIKEHKRSLEKNKHDNRKMQFVFNKYKTFEAQILVECDESIVRDYEQDYISGNWEDPKYLNLNPMANKPPDVTGNAWNRGRKHTDETKAKVSAAGKGRKMSEEHKAKISAAQKGRQFTEEHKAKMRKPKTKKIEV